MPETFRHRGRSREVANILQPGGHFLNQPGEAIELRQLSLHRIVERQQVTHVFECVVNLRVRQRTAPPIGPLFSFGWFGA